MKNKRNECTVTGHRRKRPIVRFFMTLDKVVWIEVTDCREPCLSHF